MNAPAEQSLFVRGLRKVSSARSDLHSRPLSDYTIILLSVALLTAIGVVMVFSSSMTWSVYDGNTVWGTALRQGVMVALGVIAFWLALKVKLGTIRRFALPLLIVAIVLLVLVLIPGIGTGKEEVGSQSWIVLGPLRLQPSELAKVAIAVWGASYLSDRRETQALMQDKLTHFIGVSLLMVVLIILEGDLGMAVTFLIVVGFVAFFAGLRMSFIISALIIGVLGMFALVMRGGGFRSDRFTVYFDALFGKFHDTKGSAFQSYQGFLSLADGSLLGVGLGQSRAKWFYLPEAKNDFIFAVIGEELGLWGGAMVIILFAILGYYGMRTAMRAKNQFISLMAATLTAGVVVQAFINIGYVVGLLPVTGIQLPMISAGGTSAIITLGSMGLLANCARHEPEAMSAMQSYGRSRFDRVLALPEPDASDLEINADRKKQEVRPDRFGEPVTQRSPHGPQGRSGQQTKADTRRRVASDFEPRRTDSRRTDPRRETTRQTTTRQAAERGGATRRPTAERSAGGRVEPIGREASPRRGERPQDRRQSRPRNAQERRTDGMNRDR